MAKFLRVSVLLLAAIIAFSPAMTTPTNAQGGDGGIVIDATFGTGPNTLSPIFCNDTACARVTGLMFPTLGAVDGAKTLAEVTPGAAGGLAKSWKVSDDGKVITFTLRDDWKWSDGSVITAKDVELYYTIVTNPDTKSPLVSSYVDVASVKATDDKTLVVTFKEFSCRAINQASGLNAVPTSFYGKAAVATLKDDKVNTAPNITAGPFKFGEFRASERTSLLADKNFPDAVEKAVKPEGYLYKVVPNQNVLIEQLIAGEVTFQDNIPPARVKDILAAKDAGKLQVYEWAGRTWDYIALNYADPSKPETAVVDGKIVKQTPHPILSDVKVRRALALAVDVDAIIKGAAAGYGKRQASSQIASSPYVNKDLKPLPFDPEAAKKLLDEAGWKVGADGIREKDGKKLKFTLKTNAGNTRREAIGTIAKDAWKAIGVDADFQAIDFNVLVTELRGQKFDAAILGWQNGFPADPDQTSLFTAEGDIPDKGQNYTSYYNPEVDKLMKEAKAVPGCKFEDRAKLYNQIQTIMQNDLPYIWMFSQNGYYVASTKIKGFKPFDNLPLWNVDSWTVAK